MSRDPVIRMVLAIAAIDVMALMVVVVGAGLGLRI